MRLAGRAQHAATSSATCSGWLRVRPATLSTPHLCALGDFGGHKALHSQHCKEVQAVEGGYGRGRGRCRRDRADCRVDATLAAPLGRSCPSEMLMLLLLLLLPARANVLPGKAGAPRHGDGARDGRRLAAAAGVGRDVKSRMWDRSQGHDRSSSLPAAADRLPCGAHPAGCTQRRSISKSKQQPAGSEDKGRTCFWVAYFVPRAQIAR